MLKKVNGFIVLIGVLMLSSNVFASNILIIEPINKLPIEVISKTELLKYDFMKSWKLGEKSVFGELYGSPLDRFELYDNKNVEIGQLVLDQKNDIVNLNLEKQIMLDKDISDNSTNIKEKEVLDIVEKWKEILSSDLNDELNNKPIIQDIDDRYIYQYIRIVNFIDYPDNYIRFEISKETGQLLNYDKNWKPQMENLPNFSKLIEENIANREYLDKIGYELYFDKINIDNPMKIVYKSNYENEYYLDAITSQILPNRDSTTKLNKDRFDGEDFSTVDRKKIFGILTNNDILKILKQSRLIQINENYEIQHVRVYKSLSEDYQYIMKVNLNYKNEELELHLNAITGEILDFDFYGNRERENIEISRQTALKLAKELLKVNYPVYYSEVEVAENSNDFEDEYLDYFEFKFQRKIDDIISMNDYIIIKVDRYSTRIIGFEKKWSIYRPQIEKNIIDTEILDEKFIEKINLKRKLIKFGLDYKVVYYIDTEKPYKINALTGNLFDLKFEENQEYTNKPYEDLTGHYIENEANKLKRMGLYFLEDKLNPQLYASEEDLVTLGEQILGIEYDIYSENLYKKINKITKLELLVENAKDKINMEQAYIFFIDLMYSENLNKDNLESELIVDQEYEIVKSLGFVSDKKEYKDPKFLSRAELIHILYQFKSNIK